MDGEKRERIEIRRIESTKVVYDDSVGVGGVVMESLVDPVAVSLRYREESRFLLDLERCRRVLLHPMERVREYIRQAQEYERVVHYWARQFHRDMVTPRTVCYGAYREQDNALIGYVSVQKPQESVRMSLWSRIYEYWLKIKYKILDLFFDPTNPQFHHIVTQSIEEYSQCVPSQDGLAKMTYEQLKFANYPLNRYHYIKHLLILPEYQEKGIIEHLLTTVIQDLPNAPIEFHSKGQVALGPSKINIVATEEFKRICSSLGFIKQTTYTIDTHEGAIILSLMQKPLVS